MGAGDWFIGGDGAPDEEGCEGCGGLGAADDYGGVEGHCGLVIYEAVGRGEGLYGDGAGEKACGGVPVGWRWLSSSQRYVGGVGGGEVCWVPVRRREEFVDEVDVDLEPDAPLCWGNLGPK